MGSTHTASDFDPAIEGRWVVHEPGVASYAGPIRAAMIASVFGRRKTSEGYRSHEPTSGGGQATGHVHPDAKVSVHPLAGGGSEEPALTSEEPLGRGGRLSPAEASAGPAFDQNQAIRSGSSEGSTSATREIETRREPAGVTAGTSTKPGDGIGSVGSVAPAANHGALSPRCVHCDGDGYTMGLDGPWVCRPCRGTGRAR